MPSSRPEPRTWRVGSPRPAAPVAAPEVAAPVPRPTPGQVLRVGRTWGARQPQELPDAARWSGWLALALTEALLGRRPATQLTGWVADDVVAGLNRRQRLHAADEAAARTVLLSGRVQHPAPLAVEATAVLRSGPRTVVLAFRLEGCGRGWLCTALEAGVTSGPRRRDRRSGLSSASSAAG
nr:Rv3235 family protein [Microlunatus antarcticus]